MEKIKLKRKTLIHIAMKNEHVLKSVYTVLREEKPEATIVHPQSVKEPQLFYCEAYTPKSPMGNFGKTKHFFYWPDEKPIYKTLLEILKSKNLKLI